MNKRNFKEIRDLLLLELNGSRKTINQLAQNSGVNWKTTQHHLVYLLGKGMVKEVFSSPYVRIFELTDTGEEYVGIINPKSSVRFFEPADGNKTVTLRVTR